MLGVSHASVFQWEERGVLPRDPLADKIAGLLSSSVAFLMTGEQAAPAEAPRTIDDVVEEARLAIAEIAGMDHERVRITVRMDAVR